ncbi:MAG: SulP family inorganic anion transporter [Limnothrix sp.]
MRRVFTQQAWFSNVSGDVLAGIVVALALIPESIAFSGVAGVPPEVGLYASICMAIVISFTGGRPAMISAATGAMALLIPELIQKFPDDLELGLQYLFATTILTGLLQLVWGWMKLGNHMRFVPRPVMVGFINALAILIFKAQLSQLTNANIEPGETPQNLVLVYVLVAVGLAIIYGLPQLVKLLPKVVRNVLQILPAPLVAIAAITIVSINLGWGANNEVNVVQDLGALPSTFPLFSLPRIPFTFQSLAIILPYALALSFVGLIDSFLTANVVDDMMDATTPSDKNQEALGQGVSNILVGFFGGMAGCGMIGQSVINVSSGAKTRLSTLTAGIFLLVCILLLNQWVAQIPMAVLVSVMFMVSFSTFSWGSLKTLKVVPKSETAVMLTTVATTILTSNLAFGVLVGVALSTIFFSRKIAALVDVTSTLNDDASARVYHVSGQIFFVSVESLLTSFRFKENLDRVVLDLTHAQLWDQSAVDAVDKIVLRFRQRDIEVQLQGLNEASATLIERLAIHHKTEDELVEMPIR